MRKLDNLETRIRLQRGKRKKISIQHSTSKPKKTPRKKGRKWLVILTDPAPKFEKKDRGKGNKDG